MVIKQLLLIHVSQNLGDSLIFLGGLALLQLDNCFHNFFNDVLELVGGVGDGVQLFLHQLLHIEATHDLLGYIGVFGFGFDILWLEGLRRYSNGYFGL